MEKENHMDKTDLEQLRAERDALLSRVDELEERYRLKRPRGIKLKTDEHVSLAGWDFPISEKHSVRLEQLISEIAVQQASEVWAGAVDAGYFSVRFGDDGQTFEMWTCLEGVEGGDLTLDCDFIKWLDWELDYAADEKDEEVTARLKKWGDSFMRAAAKIFEVTGKSAAPPT